MKFENVIRKLGHALYKSVRRFPVTLILTTSLAILLVFISEIRSASNTVLMDKLERASMIVALGIPVSLCIKLILERYKSFKIYRVITIHMAGLLILMLYYVFLLNNLNMVSVTRYIAVNLSLYLCFLFVPYLPKRAGFENYIIRLLTYFFTTILYSIVLFLGLSAILFTVNKLLGVSVYSKTYYYTWLFVACIFAPTLFLSGVPEKNETVDAEYYPRLLKILLLYIIMPLLTVYLIILYIYFGKIIVTRQWPMGLVSNLVLWYSAIDLMVVFLINPLIIDNKWGRFFSSWIPKIILPILAMMFISMGIRVNEYGITENRYYVMILGIWVTAIMIYFSISKSLRNIFVPISLSIIALLSVFGPVSSYSLSIYSQNSRLQGILTKNDMLDGNKIQWTHKSVPQGDREEISRILDYFRNNHALKDVKYLPAGFTIDNMKQVFGFPYEDVHQKSPDNYFNFTSDQNKGGIEISGYDYLFDTRNFNVKNNSPNDSISVDYNYENSLVSVYYRGKKVFSKDLKIYANQLLKRYEGNTNINEAAPENMTFTEKNSSLKIKFVFSNISGNTNQLTGNIKNISADFYMLIKIIK